MMRWCDIECLPEIVQDQIARTVHRDLLRPVLVQLVFFASKLPGWRMMLEASGGMVKENLVFYLAGREYAWRFCDVPCQMQLLQLSRHLKDKPKLRLCDYKVANVMGKSLENQLYGSVSFLYSGAIIESDSD